MARARSADRLREFNDGLALSASRATRQPNAQLLRRRLRYAHQHADKALRHRFGRECFFDEVSDAILNAQPRTQTRRPAWLGIFEFCDRIERLLHRAIVTARSRFLAKAYESGAEQRLQLDVFFFGHLLADLHKRILQPLARRFAVKFGELA